MNIHRIAVCVMFLIQVRAEDATVILYRPNQFYGHGRATTIFVDDRAIEVKNGRYISLHLIPGRHALRPSRNADSLDLDLAKAKTVYVKIIIRGRLRGGTRLILVGADQGTAAISKLKALDANSVPPPVSR